MTESGGRVAGDDDAPVAVAFGQPDRGGGSLAGAHKHGLVEAKNRDESELKN